MYLVSLFIDSFWTKPNGVINIMKTSREEKNVKRWQKRHKRCNEISLALKTKWVFGSDRRILKSPRVRYFCHLAKHISTGRHHKNTKKLVESQKFLPGRWAWAVYPASPTRTIRKVIGGRLTSRKPRRWPLLRWKDTIARDAGREGRQPRIGPGGRSSGGAGPR